MMDSTELGHYSYAKLLRDREAMDSDPEDDDDMSVSKMDFELATLPDDWCAKFLNEAKSNGLLDDLYVEPEMEMLDQNMCDAGVEGDKKGLRRRIKESGGMC
jgi:hypothetical protein